MRPGGVEVANRKNCGKVVDGLGFALLECCLFSAACVYVVGEAQVGVNLGKGAAV